MSMSLLMIYQSYGFRIFQIIQTLQSSCVISQSNMSICIGIQTEFYRDSTLVYVLDVHL